MSRLVSNLYILASWLALATMGFLFIGDLWRGMGLASAYVLYRLIGNEYHRELQGSYLKGLAENGSEQVEK